MNYIKVVVLTLILLISLTSCGETGLSTEKPIQSEETAAISEGASQSKAITSSVEASQSEPPASNGFILHMKESEGEYQVEGCIVDVFSIIYEDNGFPDQKAIRLAKEKIYSTGMWGDLLYDYAEYHPDVSAEPALDFICGAYEDFDGDGKNESVILVGVRNIVSMFENHYYVYVDENNAVNFMASLEVERFELLRFGDTVCVGLTRTWMTGLGSGEAIFTFFDGTPRSVFDSLGGRSFSYARGYFSCYDYYKFVMGWQSIAIWDNELKTFRGLGIEEISRETFADYFDNGRAGLDYFEAMTGKNDYKIYTQGYVYFFLCVSEEITYIFKIDENGEAKIEDSPQPFASYYLEANDYSLYGINANNLETAYSLDLSAETIGRINELAQKSKTYGEGLTEDEQAEFEVLKNEYIATINS